MEMNAKIKLFTTQITRTWGASQICWLVEMEYCLILSCCITDVISCYISNYSERLNQGIHLLPEESMNASFGYMDMRLPGSWPCSLGFTCKRHSGVEKAKGVPPCRSYGLRKLMNPVTSYLGRGRRLAWRLTQRSPQVWYFTIGEACNVPPSICSRWMWLFVEYFCDTWLSEY